MGWQRRKVLGMAVVLASQPAQARKDSVGLTGNRQSLKISEEKQHTGFNMMDLVVVRRMDRKLRN